MTKAEEFRRVLHEIAMQSMKGKATMQCPRCHGSRRIATVPIERMDGFMLHYEVIDCPYCDGTGIVDCCDGDVAQDYVLRGSPEAIENFKRLAGFKSDDGS